MLGFVGISKWLTYKNQLMAYLPSNYIKPGNYIKYPAIGLCQEKISCSVPLIRNNQEPLITFSVFF